MPVPYDTRRFRTTADILVPKGTLIVSAPNGSGTVASDDSITLTVLDLAEAEFMGLVRQLADGEA